MDRRVEKTQRAIKDGFTELIENNDIDKITIQMICDKANIGRKTFYLHYTDKYELMDKFFDNYLNDLFKACDGITNENLKEKTDIWLSFFAKNKEFFQNLFQNNQSYIFKKKFNEFTKKSLLSKKIFFDDTTISFLTYGIDGLMEDVVLSNDVLDENLSDKIVKILKLFY